MAAASAPEATSLATPAAVIKCMEAAQRGRELNDVAPLAPEGLVPALYPYQSAAVRWMMDRERGVDGAAVAARAARLFGRDDAGAALDGDGLRGGLLCDEMGLGKTVAVAIAGQWLGELRSKAPSLVVLEYPGIQALQQGARRARRALERAVGADAAAAAALRDCLRRADGSAFAEDADVVVATFSALQRDAHYVSRGATPLVAVDWFRCVVDEAQHVQGGASAAAAVARAVRATRRWGAAVLRDLAFAPVERFVYDELDARCRAGLPLDGDALGVRGQGGGGPAPGPLPPARARGRRALPRGPRGGRPRLRGRRAGVAARARGAWLRDAAGFYDECRALVRRGREPARGLRVAGLHVAADGGGEGWVRTSREPPPRAPAADEAAFVEFAGPGWARLALGKARRVVAVEVAASARGAFALEARGAAGFVRRSDSASPPASASVVEIPDAIKADAYRLVAEGPAVVAVAFREARVESDDLTELHVAHNLAEALERLEALGDGGAPTAALRALAKRLRGNYNGQHVDRVAQLVADARAAVGRGAGAALDAAAAPSAWWRGALRRDGALDACEAALNEASANCFGSPASRPGFEFRCGAAGRRVEAAVGAALRRVSGDARRGARRARGPGLRRRRRLRAGDGARGRLRRLRGGLGRDRSRCPNCARVDAIDACRAQLKSRRGGAERSGVEVNAPATRALCALARFGDRRAATATLDALGCGANGESRLAANRDAGIKHEMLLASRAASQAIFALLRENEALSAARRLTDMEAELEGAAAATELAALEKTLAFLESHAVADGARGPRRRREDCVICLEALDGACVYGDGACVAVLPCGHGFHGACLDRVRRSRCPSCNANFSASDVRRAVAATSPEPASGAPGAHGTKLDAFLRDAKAAAARGDQSVVFSNFEEVLDFVARALADAELAVARFTPAGVADFTAPRSSIPFLLAPVGRANNGLTLVNATNVFLLEPPTSHAVELQCVNRVHRVGQRRPTTVFRYVVGATVEAAIHGGHEALARRRPTRRTSSCQGDGRVRRRGRPGLDHAAKRAYGGVTGA
ncbi:ATP binding protein [Aureococcus anophagefferens]|nr:ATP binding protein [Aureococcus anophagefferens]